MTILGLETSTAVCSAGLYRDNEPVIERSLRESHIHSEKLLTLVHEVVREASIAMKDLDAIAISIGPGSFTGLRIGLSTAKGLAYSLGKPLVSIGTFDAIAEAAKKGQRGMSVLLIVVDAKKEEWYIGSFKSVPGQLVEPMKVDLLSTTEVLATIKASPSPLVLTDRVAELRQMIGDSAAVEDVHPYCRGGVVASMGLEKILRKEFSEVATLEPLYLKDFFVRTASHHSSLSGH